MIHINTLVFNSFAVNTFVISDSNGNCVIIDPGCEDDYEQKRLAAFIDQKKLKPLALINTHFHVDHILGNLFVSQKYGIKPTGHKGSKIFWETAKEFGTVFNLQVHEIVKPEIFVEDGDVLNYGDIQLEVRYTPGHADGSICLVSHEGRFVVAGDVLFNGSIGRTDLPTGDFDVLMESIRQKLFTLPDDYTVYPGHGPETSIGYEKITNPFLI